MDVVQWLAPLADRDDVAVCFAPAWADRLPRTASLPALRRRSAPLVCKHLARPIAIAVAADVGDAPDDDRATSLPGAPGLISLCVHLSADGAPLLDAKADDVRFAATLSEFVGVVIDVVEAAGLPLMGALPVDERRALQLVLGGLQGSTRSRLADALLLFAGAVETCALARGFQASCSLLVPLDRRSDRGGGTRAVPLNARIEEAL